MNYELRTIIENLCENLTVILREADSALTELEESHTPNGKTVPDFDVATAAMDCALTDAIYRIKAEKHSLYSASRIWDTN